MSKIKIYIQNNCLLWVSNMAQLFMVAHISYYFLKMLTNVSMVEAIWDDNERYYLSTYAGLQVVVTYVFYKGIGILVELYLNWWIKRNEKDVAVPMEREGSKEISKLVHVIFSILVFFNFLSIDELDQLDEIGETPEEHEKKWRKTILIWKNAVGLLILGLTTSIITWEADLLFLVLGIILAMLIIGSVFVMIMYYVLIKNLHLVNAFIKGYNSSFRLMRQKNKKQNIIP